MTKPQEAFEEELVANALSEMRKREAMGLLSGSDVKAKVYPARLDADLAEQRRDGLPDFSISLSFSLS